MTTTTEGEEEREFLSGMGADSQSPLGTAFAFSRPNNLALSLSNTSLLLEYTSRVFINSLQETGDNNRIKRQGGERTKINGIFPIGHRPSPTT